MIDTDDLRTFLEVAESGGLTPAARRLGLSKSIVSRQLARLEGALGVQLFARTTRGAILTEEGAIFREHAGRVTAELDAAQDALSADGEVRGRLRIAVPLSDSNRVPPRGVASTRPRHRDLRQVVARRHCLICVADWVRTAAVGSLHTQG
jgi:DNA-binding transcriptional LysR family regulator